MTPINALVLGVVQGLTEFLPISSSGHLLLVPRLFGWDEQPLAFEVALHAGTLLALAIYFGRDWWVLIRETLADIGRAGPHVRDWGAYGRLAFLIAVAAVPAVLAGLAAGGIEDRLRTPGVVAAMLVLVGITMAAAERWPSAGGAAGGMRLTVMQAGLVGMAQACALVPGVSRSGSTIVAGMAAGLSRATAARFSFLLALPITLAALKEYPVSAGRRQRAAWRLRSALARRSFVACWQSPSYCATWRSTGATSLSGIEWHSPPSCS